MMKMRKKMIAMLCVCAMLVSLVVPMTIFAATTAGVQSDGTFLIADFSDKNTCDAWGKGRVNDFNLSGMRGVYSNGRYDTDWQTDSGGDYMKNEAAAFADLNFADYKELEFSFNMAASYHDSTRNNYVPNVKNWVTIVLSTGKSAGDYSTYKNNECLTYEIDLSQYTIPDTSDGLDVTVSVPLSSFVTQFDGMAGGEQGETDGVTPLGSIKSISILGAGMGMSAVGGVGNGTAWSYKNSKWADVNGCGFCFKRLSLSKGDASKIKAAIDAQMADYRIVSGNIELPVSVDGYPGSIAWASSHPEIIAANGSYTQPQSNTVVTLTANITADDTTTITATYYVGVKGSEPVQNRTIADFSQEGVGQAWDDASEMPGHEHSGNVKDGWYEYVWTRYATGGGYLSSHPEKFADLDFADYKGLRLNIWSNRTEPLNENYFTVILSTAKDPKSTYKTDECAVIEVDLRSLPRNKQSSIYLPFNEFITEFDGMSGGVQGVADGITDFSQIKSISIYAGAAKADVNGWNGIGATSEKLHAYTDWAFKGGADTETRSCAMFLYSVDLLTEEPSSTLALYKKDGATFTDLTAAAEICGKVTLSAVPKDTKIYTVTALYDAQGQLVDVGFEEKTVGNGEITTPTVSYDPAKHKKAAAFIWDTDFTPLVTEAIKTR